MKNTAIEFLRFYFMLVICLWHFDFCEGLLHHGYLAVEFFFLLSGFFISISANHKEKTTALQYSWKKIKRLYPEYFAVVIAYWILYIVSNLISGDILELKSYLCGFISEVTLLQQIGVFKGAINGSCWYLCVLIWGGGVVYAMIRNYRDLSVSIIFPVVIISTYCFLFSQSDSIECWESYGCFHMPFWRGIAGMCLGAVLSEIIEACNRSNHLDRHIWMLDVSACTCLLFVTYMFFDSNTYDACAIILFCVIITDVMLPRGLLNRLFSGRVSNFLGGISYEMLLLNFPLVFVVKWANSNILHLEYRVLIFLYVAILLVLSYALKRGANMIRKKSSVSH